MTNFFMIDTLELVQRSWEPDNAPTVWGVQKYNKREISLSIPGARKLIGLFYS